MQGNVKQTFLINDAIGAQADEICISNSEATLLPADLTKQENGTVKRQYPGWLVHKKQGGVSRSESTNRVSFDGIYVCGDAGYSGNENDDFRWASYITHYRNLIDNGNSTFTLNVKGSLKAPLTPARAPLNPYNRRNLLPEWQRLADYVAIAIARIYENLIAQRIGEINPEDYWRLFVYNRFDLQYLRMGEAWRYLRIPCVDSNDNTIYLPLSELGPLTEVAPLAEEGFKRNYRQDALYTQQGLACHMIDMKLWEPQGSDGSRSAITNLLTAFSTLSIADNRYVLTPTSPNEPELLVGSRFIGRQPNYDLFSIPYLFESHDVVLTAYTRTANFNNPLVKLAMISFEKRNPIPIEQFSLELLKLHNTSEDSIVQSIEGKGEPEALTTRLGLLYSMVNWNACSPELKPPYKIHFPSRKVIELTDDVLMKWSKEEYTCRNY